MLKFSHLLLTEERSVANTKDKSYFNAKRAEVNSLKLINGFVTPQKTQSYHEPLKPQLEPTTVKTCPAKLQKSEPPKQRCLDYDDFILKKNSKSEAALTYRQAMHSYSYLFEGCCIFISLTDTLTKSQVSRICEVSGGIIMPSITTHTTHVVSDLLDDEVLVQAKRLNVKVILQGWVLDSFSLKEKVEEDNYIIE